MKSNNNNELKKELIKMKNKFDIEEWNTKPENKELSYNVYNEDSQILLAKCCNYLIWQGKEVTPCNNLTTAINIAKETKSIATIFESISSKGRYWKYMCDVSHGIFNEGSAL